jgi:hypothetical protein
LRGIEATVYRQSHNGIAGMSPAVLIPGVGQAVFDGAVEYRCRVHDAPFPCPSKKWSTLAAVEHLKSFG